MPKPLILVTGATGHLGFRTLIIALENGYRVRVALRSLGKSEALKKTASLQKYLDSVEFVEVPDITADHAYDEAIKGVVAALHIASPIYTGMDPKDHNWRKLLYDPAERGTKSMLAAAAKESSVKKVVITSSVVTLEPKNGSNRMGPHDLKALPDQETLDSMESSPAAYALSKVLAHHAGTNFMETHKPDFALVRVSPGYIQGANELLTTVEELRNNVTSGSNEGTVNTALGTASGPRVTAQVYVDDVAKAHVYALKDDVAKNGDHFVIMGNGGNSVGWDQFVPIIKRLFPKAVEKGVLMPKADNDSPLALTDVSSSEKALGFTFAGPEEMVKSVVGQYLTLAGEPLE